MNTFFLSAPDEATLLAALTDAGYTMDGQYGIRFTLSDWTPCENHTPGAKRHDVDIVGDVDGSFCANLTAHELHKALTPYQIEPPATPKRAPCAATCTKAATKVYDAPPKTAPTGTKG